MKGNKRDKRKKLTSWCAAAALLQNARVTSSDFRTPVASLERSSSIVELVMANSSSVNHPDVSGQPVTSSCDSGGIKFSGMRHSLGIEACSSLRFFAPISSHDRFAPLAAFTPLAAALLAPLVRLESPETVMSTVIFVCNLL